MKIGSLWHHYGAITFHSLPSRHALNNRVEIGVRDDASFAQWREEYGDAWEQERRCARASLTAALALAEEAGALLVRVPTNADQWDSPGYDHGTPPNIIWADGHNACRAATLAGRVTL